MAGHLPDGEWYSTRDVKNGTWLQLIANAEQRIAYRQCPVGPTPIQIIGGESEEGCQSALPFSFGAGPDDLHDIGLQLILPNDGLRIRELISRSRNVMTGKYPSWKMGRFMHWESRLESKVFRLLDTCVAVKRFAEQPLIVRYLVNEKWHSHVPDVAVEIISGDRWLLEIKNRKDPKRLEAIRRAEILAPRLELVGCKYAVIDQEDIEAGMSLENACLLLKYGREQPSSKAHKEFVDLVASGAHFGRRGLLGMVIEGEHAIRTGSQLALRGYVSPNWSIGNTRSLEFCAATDNNIEEALQWLLRALGATKRL